jgi:LPXTG-motif cell wall-anchored protein
MEEDEQLKKFKKLPFLLAIILLLSMTLSPFVSADEPKKLNVVSLGDSITYGYGLSDLNKAYPHLIGNRLNNVTNISHPGWTSTDLLTALKTGQATAKLQEADVITLNIGANDLMQAIGLGEIITSQQPFVPTEEHLNKISLASNQLAVNLQELIAIIRANSAAPILLYSIYNPFGQSQDPFAASLHMLGEQVTTNVNTLVLGPLSSVTGAIYLDTNSTFNGNQSTYIIPGDIHPTLAGHEALAKLATNALIAIQPPKEEITIEEPVLSTIEETSDPVVVTLTENKDITEFKWLPGEKAIADFANAGTVVNGNTFKITENGSYTIYAKSTSGSEAVRVFTISNIVPKVIEEPIKEEPVEVDPEEVEPPAENQPPTPPVEKPVDTKPNENENKQPEKSPAKSVETPKKEETPKIEVSKTPTVKTGHTLPNTATSMFNLLTVGFCLIIVGAGVFMIQRTRRLKSEKTHF